ncbi:acyl-CoA dehydrogenase family protein [Pedobacter aquatilis]|uniref:acyl-CoA dehydrogenase family protein n=1 Tax=Pedobacter aquatilis TaxID=351343 RepID=UPI0025B49A81|nr:acyl-CoA dehydrogenase family protein [Pedobacter aquatilis]MDN3586236.1 acyl-CoA dehydrogenase family protein [Pedobacter aquatilis]
MKEIYKPSSKFNQDELHQQALNEIAKQAEICEAHPEEIRESIKTLAKAGLLSIVLPGAPLDFNLGNTKALLQILKDVGKANLSVGRIFEGHINALHLIHLYANQDQKRIWFEEVRTKNFLFAVWNTQESDGIHFIPTGQGFELRGSKSFCSGAGVVNRAIVTGNIDTQERNGWQMAVLPMANLNQHKIDKNSWQPLGMKASCSYKVDFSAYPVSAEDLLSSPGIYLKQPYFSAGAIRFAAVQLGGAEAIAADTLSFLKNLSRTADPIQRLRLSSISTQLISGRLWISRAGEEFDKLHGQSEHGAALVTLANMARVMVEEICLLIIQDSNKCVGARGLMRPGSLERLHRDLTFYLRQPAPDLTRLNISDFFINNEDEFERFGI